MPRLQATWATLLLTIRTFMKRFCRLTMGFSRKIENLEAAVNLHMAYFNFCWRPGEMKVTVRLKRVPVGTEVNIVQEGLPDVIPPDACTLGWQESLTLLAKLVEAEIPG